MRKPLGIPYESVFSPSHQPFARGSFGQNEKQHVPWQ